VKHEIDPWALAILSPLYKSIPPPKDDIFELNQSGYLQTENDVNCFLAMCRDSGLALTDKQMPSLDPMFTADQPWCNPASFYAASRLCDFLGIKAASMISSYSKFRKTLTTGRLDDPSYVLGRIIYHQIALLTHNDKAREEIVEHLSDLYRKQSEQEQFRRAAPLSSIQVPAKTYNDAIMAINQLYYTLSIRPHPIDALNRKFLVDTLGWHARENTYYSFRIIFAD